ncbi:hypothetical protein DENIS_0165 [Desulfonema ishimotonii]|uniref:Uridine phosphorylase n=1 Tax=Desulfonema ishimotonii TaxID=45657 RepID=A0A401FQG0_9BACT|nr:nucleoside phosphorylase [Desulfonema ishimotonii]GBC59229.1 hypothetical protein DENIS_0165 [Desulfonema ishimotonii]
MIPGNDAVINPSKGKKAPAPGPLAVMVSSQGDVNALCNLMSLNGRPAAHLMMSQVRMPADPESRFSLTGPVVSAPYAVMLLETLVAWGAREIIFFGWCGSLSPHVRIGDIVLPTGAIIDEGTSPGYDGQHLGTALPSGEMNNRIRTALKNHDLSFHEGAIWSTDAIYRETREKVKYFQARNAVGVEMELSALFTAGKFRNVRVGAVLVVSDELATLTWQPGFKDKRFRNSRSAVAEVIKELCQTVP